MSDANLDRWLRLIGWACVACGILTLYMVAPLYAPRPNSSEAVLMDKCLAAHGFPLLDSWTGNMTGCGR